MIAFADAAVARSRAVSESRDRVQKALGDAGVVDAAAIIANFQRMVRIADGTGIPLDAPVDLLSADIRHELGINEFASASDRGKNGALRRLADRLRRLGGRSRKLPGRRPYDEADLSDDGGAAGSSVGLTSQIGGPRSFAL